MIMSRVNRRPQYILSSATMSFCLLLLGAFNFGPLTSLPLMDAAQRYLALPCVLLLGFGYGAGVGPVPYTLTGELFPQQYKSFGCSFCIAMRYDVD